VKRSVFRRRVSALPPAPQPFTAKAEGEVLKALRRLADRPRTPRTPEKRVAIIERERAAWGKERPPRQETALAECFRRLVGSPDPRDYETADAYATAFGSWLEKSDRDLAGEAGQRTALATPAMTGTDAAGAEDGHTP